ncbi:MAG: tetratricopeptide repeat protein [Candidatus Humimicrobiia bacterium]
MKKNTGHWLKRARTKLQITQKDLVGDRFKRQYISMIETGDVDLSPGVRAYITKKLKLPKKYFDTGLFKEEKERLDYLKEETNTLLDSLRFDEANKLIKEAVSISSEAKSDEYINHFLLKLVQVYINDKKLDKAKDLLIKTNKYYSEERDYKNLAYSYYWTGVLYRDKKKYTNALYMFNNAIEENSKLERKKDLSIKARATTKIAQVYRHTENYKGAKEKYEEAIEIAKKAENNNVLATAYWGYSILLRREKKFQEAINFYKKASLIYRQLKQERNYLSININLANLYYYIGDYDKAINLANSAIKISKEKEYEKELSYALLYRAKAKREKGLLDNSESDLKRSINLLEKLKDKRMLAVAYMSLGLLYEVKKENDKAIFYFNKAVDIFKELDQPIFIHSAYGEIIRFYKEIGNYDKVIKHTQKLINLTKRIKF